MGLLIEFWISESVGSPVFFVLDVSILILRFCFFLPLCFCLQFLYPSVVGLLRQPQPFKSLLGCVGFPVGHDLLAAEIRQRGIRRREFERFITTLESLPDQVTDFDETLWGSLAVYAKGDLRFMLACEVEITA